VIDNQNQTNFTFEEPLLESVSVPEAPEIAAPDEDETSQPKKKKLLVLAAVGLSVFVLLILVFMVLVSTPEESAEEFVESTPTPTVTTDLSPEMVAFEELEARLQVIDPARDYLPQPAVDYEISLEE